MKKKLLSIGDVSKISGVHIKSLRYYDRIGVLQPAYTDPDTRYRYYSASQLGIVEAIQTCVELDIPLKEFSNYVDDDGRTIHYKRLLEHGKELAEKKIGTIRSGLKVISEMQQEIERSDRFSKMKQPIVYDVPLKRYFVEPLTHDSDDDGYNMMAVRSLYFRAMENGYKPSYEYGRLYIYHRRDIERYQYINILSAVKKNEPGIIVCPAARCQVKHVPESKIETAPAEFPELFVDNFDLVLIESELFTGDFNVENPQYELRCSVLNR